MMKPATPDLHLILLGWACALILALGPAVARACPDQAPESCHLARARTLLDKGHYREAIVQLKEAVRRFPESRTIALLLARAYLADGNAIWASRTLADWLKDHPGDCVAGHWLAWIDLGLGMLDDARAMVDEAECTGPDRLAARSDLLRALIARYEDRPDEALTRLDRAYTARELFPEDREAVAHLKPELDPWYLPPLAFRFEAWAGWTSNGLAGSPTDTRPAGSSDAQSGFASLAAWGRFAPDIGLPVRPLLEADLRGIGYLSGSVRDHSYLMLSGRPGILAGGSRWNLLAAYRFETLLLAGGDRYESGPLLYYSAHRGELEAAPLPWLTLFVGAGQRRFREMGRDRIEVDGGAGGSRHLVAGLSLTGALSGRWHAAHNSAYDLYGGTLIATLEYRLPYGIGIRGGLSASLDRYPGSAGYFDPLKPDTVRRDVLIKPAIGIWSPALYGVRAGLIYEYSRRFSTAGPYAYSDHRVTVRLFRPLSLDPWLPRKVKPADHVPLEWGIEGGTDAGGERIQDLLRQDEAVRRGSSCVE